MPDPSTTVLLVDDDLFFAARILSVLGAAGYRVDHVTDAASAPTRCAEARPDLALVNLGSRGLDGMEALRGLAAADPAPPIVAYAPHVRIPDLREAARAAGAVRVVPNSAIASRLVEVIRDALRRAAAAGTGSSSP